MTHTLARICVLVLALAPVSTRAGEPCRRVFPLASGSPAPCTGDLYPVAEARRLLEAEDELDHARSLLLSEQDARAADTRFAQTLLDTERAARRACETQHAPPPARAPRWYESPWVGFGVGVVLTGTLAVALAVAL